MNELLDLNREWIEEYWQKTVEKLRRNSVTLRDKIPLVTEDGVYDDHSKSSAWTNGFWPGIMWLMYSATGEDCFKETAQTAEKMMDTALANYKKLHHDVGFMWHISSGASLKLTGDEKSKERALHAAATLASRYNVNGEFIRAWNDEDAPGWTIIDSMMNIPLLYWAAEECKNVSFKQIAMHHADTVLKDHIRPDGSVYHIVMYDVESGECLGAAPSTQGYEPQNSSWSRGQSWALYGFTLSYIHTGEQRYLDAAKRVAHYFIANVCNTNYIPLADFRAPAEPVYIDSSAGALAACGLIELAKVVPEYEKKMYMQAAINIMKALCDTQCDFSDKEQSILQNSSACYARGVHRPWIYGEYFYVEAMYKLMGFEPQLW